MDDNANKGLFIGIGVILTIAIISIAIFFFNSSKNMTDTANKNLDSLATSVNNSTYSQYDETVVSGSDVISTISRFANNGFTVTVITATNSKGKTYTSSYNITDITNPDYIEKTAKFDSKLDKSDNGTVIGITFTQK